MAGAGVLKRRSESIAKGMIAAVRYARNCMTSWQCSQAAFSWYYVLFLLVCAFQDIDSYNTCSELLCEQITLQIMSFALLTASIVLRLHAFSPYTHTIVKQQGSRKSTRWLAFSYFCAQAWHIAACQGSI